ncbi:unknown [Bacteroides sp. CAG:462]|nr:unknown [Bacteroides sp. CAG:462]
MMIAHLFESGCKGTTKFHICKHHVRIFSKECANSSLGKGRKGESRNTKTGH